MLETLYYFSSVQFVLRFEPIPVELIGMSLMLCIFDPIVLDLGCLCLYGGVVFTCAVFLYYFLLCSLFSLFDRCHISFFSVYLPGMCLCCVHFLMYTASSCVSTCMAGMVLVVA